MVNSVAVSVLNLGVIIFMTMGGARVPLSFHPPKTADLLHLAPRPVK